MRLQNIILTGLIRDRLIAYEKLERLMNSDGNLYLTELRIRSLLAKISRFNGMIDEIQKINLANSGVLADSIINELNKKQNG